jgi:hypothetical protein
MTSFHRDPAPARRAIAVALRAVAAIAGGYLLAYLATRALAITLPMAPVDAVVAATLTGLVVYPCAIMWCFAAATVLRAGVGLVACCALPALVILVHQGAAVAS